jgi:hypothetical protein
VCIQAVTICVQARLTVGRPRAQTADATLEPNQQRRNGHNNVHAERAAARAAAAAQPAARPSTAPGKVDVSSNHRPAPVNQWRALSAASRDWRQQQPASEKRDWRHNTAFFRDTRDFWLFVADRALFAAGRSALGRAAPGRALQGRAPVQQGRAADLWASTGRAAVGRVGSVRAAAETAAAARSADRARRRAARSSEEKEVDENAPSLRVWSCGCSSGKLVS